MRAKVLGLLTVVMAALALAGTALADGNGTQTTQYKASYTDPYFGPVACAGVNQTGKNFPGLGQDSWTCTSTTGSPLWNVAPGQTLSFGPVFWYSDYYWFILHQLVYGNQMTGTVSLDGMSYTAVGTYY
jgi:hypothetical protein